MSRQTKNTRLINASPEKIYKAFTDPKALEVWMVPGEMTGNVYNFDLRVGGGYEMTLHYPESDGKDYGKTNKNEDRYTARFVELNPFEKIVLTNIFETDDPAFSGEMIMTITLKPFGKETEVVILFENIPPGISLKDNEAGTESSLEKLAEYVR